MSKNLLFQILEGTGVSSNNFNGTHHRIAHLDSPDPRNIPSTIKNVGKLILKTHSFLQEQLIRFCNLGPENILD